MELVVSSYYFLLFSKRIKPYLKNPMLTFVIIMVICATIEYGTGWFLETFQHAKWWDYSGYFLNLHGRICLEGTLFFGLGGSLCIYVVAPFLYRVYQKISKPVQTVLCLTLYSHICNRFYLFVSASKSGCWNYGNL